MLSEKLTERDQKYNRDAPEYNPRRLVEAIAKLGQSSMVYTNLQDLLNEAVALVVQCLGVKYVNILELIPERDVVILRAGAGWEERWVGSATLPANTYSHEVGYALLTKMDIFIENFSQEARFAPSPLLSKHRIVSGINVVIYGRARPIGTIGAYADQQRKFTLENLQFLQAIGHILGTAFEHQRARVKVFKGDPALLTLQATGMAVNIQFRSSGCVRYRRQRGCRLARRGRMRDLGLG